MIPRPQTIEELVQFLGVTPQEDLEYLDERPIGSGGGSFSRYNSDKMMGGIEAADVVNQRIIERAREDGLRSRARLAEAEMGPAQRAEMLLKQLGQGQQERATQGFIGARDADRESLMEQFKLGQQGLGERQASLLGSQEAIANRQIESAERSLGRQLTAQERIQLIAAQSRMNELDKTGENRMRELDRTFDFQGGEGDKERQTREMLLKMQQVFQGGQADKDRAMTGERQGEEINTRMLQMALQDPALRESLLRKLQAGRLEGTQSTDALKDLIDDRGLLTRLMQKLNPSNLIR